ncbi:MAG: O-antigen ligase family protein [Acidobacteriota bacterium]
MTALSNRIPSLPLVTTLFGVAAAAFTAQLIARQSLTLTFWVLTGVLLLIISFLHTRLAIYVIIFSMLLSPEVSLGFTTGRRDLTVRFEDLLLILVGLAWLARTAYYKELGLIARSPLNRQIAAYSIAAVIATLVSGWLAPLNWSRSLLYLAKYMEYFVLYFLVLTNVRSRADIKNYLAAAFITCLVVAVVGIAQIPGGARVSAPFEGETGEPNTFGGYLVLMLSLASAFYLTARSLQQRLFCAAFIALLGLPLLYTLSRGSWLALAGMFLALLAYAPDKKHLVVAGALALGLYPVLAPRQVIERVDYTFNQPEESGQMAMGDRRLDTSTSARIRSWRYGIEGWARRPLTGYGVAGFAFMDAQYVHVLTETGILGMVTFVWLTWSIWRLARDRLRRADDRFARALSLGYLAGFLALLVHGIGANTFIIIRIMEPFWLFTALVVALPHTKGDEQSPSDSQASRSGAA